MSNNRLIEEIKSNQLEAIEELERDLQEGALSDEDRREIKAQIEFLKNPVEAKKAPAHIESMSKGMTMNADNSLSIEAAPVNIPDNALFMQKVLFLKDQTKRRNSDTNKFNAFYVPLYEVLQGKVTQANGKQYDINAQIHKLIDAGKNKNSFPCLMLATNRDDGDTSRDRELYKDSCTDFTMIDIDVHENDPKINHEMMVKQAFKLGAIAYQASASGRGLHILFNVHGRGDAFNTVLQGSPDPAKHESAKRVLNKTYIDFINDITPQLLEGQNDDVKAHYGKKGTDKEYAYNLCDPAIKSIHRACYLTLHPWQLNEHAHEYVIDPVHGHANLTSELGTLHRQGYSNDEQMAIMSAAHPKIDTRSMHMLQAKNDAQIFTRWNEWEYLDTVESLDKAMRIAEARVIDQFEFGMLDGSGHVLCRLKGSNGDPIELTAQTFFNASINYIEPNKNNSNSIKALTLHQFLKSPKGLSYMGKPEFKKIYCTYGECPEGAINLAPKMPEYKILPYDASDNIRILYDFLTKKSNMMPYMAKVIINALEHPDRPTNAVIYLHDKRGGAGKSVTMDNIIKKLGPDGFMAPVEIKDADKYSNALPKAKIWYMQETEALGGKDGDFRHVTEVIKRWTGDKTFSLEIKYGAITQCQVCPIFIATVNHIERVPLELLDNRRMLPIPFKKDVSKEEMNEFTAKMDSFTRDEVYTVLHQLASEVPDFDLNDDDAELPPMIYEARKQCIRETFGALKGAKQMLENGMSLNDAIANYPRISEHTLETYYNIMLKYGLIEEQDVEIAF